MTKPQYRHPRCHRSARQQQRWCISPSASQHLSSCAVPTPAQLTNMAEIQNSAAANHAACIDEHGVVQVWRLPSEDIFIHRHTKDISFWARLQLKLQQLYPPQDLLVSCKDSLTPANRSGKFSSQHCAAPRPVSQSVLHM